jgi:hypothetical protein
VTEREETQDCSQEGGPLLFRVERGRPVGFEKKYGTDKDEKRNVSEGKGICNFTKIQSFTGESAAAASRRYD